VPARQWPRDETRFARFDDREEAETFYRAFIEIAATG
jgi:hypothetical protein